MAYQLPSTFYAEYSVRNERAAWPTRFFLFASRRHLFENKYFAHNPFRLKILQAPPTCKPLK
jgi:hypothetical protein